MNYNKQLPISLKKLEEIAAVYDTPYQLYDEQMIRENTRNLIDSFSEHFPNFKQHFAVKALPNPVILKILTSEGCGLDCSSVSELYISQKIGTSQDCVCYTSNYTSKKDLIYAIKLGVKINLDDISLLNTMAQICLEENIPFPKLISFRINPGIGFTNSDTDSNVLGGPNAKFGIPDFKVVDAYKRAKHLGATNFGIHMMTGSCVLSDEYWMKSISILFNLINELKKKLNIDIDYMNIGGGIGIPYKPNEKKVDIAKLAIKIRNLFDEKIKQYNIQEPVLHMENGRFITGPYGYLVSRCHVIKYSYETYYGLDACMANLMRPGMYGSYHHISVPRLEKSPDLLKANVVGTLCENNDWFARERPLPVGIRKGDLFVIHDTGAHSHSMGFQYNGKLRAPEILLGKDKKTTHLIRKREKIEDLFSNCIYCNIPV